MPGLVLQAHEHQTHPNERVKTRIPRIFLLESDDQTSLTIRFPDTLPDEGLEILEFEDPSKFNESFSLLLQTPQLILDFHDGRHISCEHCPLLAEDTVRVR